MSNDVVIQVDALSKRYRLGVVGTGTLSHDLNRWWAQLRGRPDPYLKIGQKTESRKQKAEIGEKSEITKTESRNKTTDKNKFQLSALDSDDPDFMWALRDVSFEVKRGEVLGIIGRNGAGKSTLLKILSRVTAPTSGQIRVKGRIASLLEVGTGFHPELTGKENIFLNGAILGMTKSEIRDKLDEIVDFSGVEKFIDTPVKRYSSGMYVRLAFAVAAHLDPEILIVDEVLAVGDAEFQKKCLGKMQDVAGQGRTVLFVSHNMAAIRSLCKSTIFLRDGNIETSASPENCISAYLGTIPSNHILFENKAVRSARIAQDQGAIQLTVDYALEQAISFPCLGFVISDAYGTKVFGTNPREQGITRVDQCKADGSVAVAINAPRLRSGHYRLSLWFGDGQKDFFRAPDCLQFEVVTTDRPYDLSAWAVGAVSPCCEWTFK